MHYIFELLKYTNWTFDSNTDGFNDFAFKFLQKNTHKLVFKTLQFYKFHTSLTFSCGKNEKAVKRSMVKNNFKYIPVTYQPFRILKRREKFYKKM